MFMAPGARVQMRGVTPPSLLTMKGLKHMCVTIPALSYPHKQLLLGHS